MFPYQITFLDFPRSEFIEKSILNRLDKLDTFFSPIIRCKVIISSPHHQSHASRQYFVEILISIPGNDVIVVNSARRTKAPHSVYDSISDAFSKAERVLKRRSEQLHKNKNKNDVALNNTTLQIVRG